jgi:hypothetical protein
MTLVTTHREWIIDATPEPHGRAFVAHAWVQREAHEGEAHGDCFIFSDLGSYLAHDDAVARAATWAARWLDDNG